MSVRKIISETDQQRSNYRDREQNLAMSGFLQITFISEVYGLFDGEGFSDDDPGKRCKGGCDDAEGDENCIENIFKNAR